jgi:hypothetical protein
MSDQNFMDLDDAPVDDETLTEFASMIVRCVHKGRLSGHNGWTRAGQVSSAMLRLRKYRFRHLLLVWWLKGMVRGALESLTKKKYVEELLPRTSPSQSARLYRLTKRGSRAYTSILQRNQARLNAAAKQGHRIAPVPLR